MIPANITAEHIHAAMEAIDHEGVPPQRQAREWVVQHEGHEYPAKYLLAVANRFANGHDLGAFVYHTNEIHEYLAQRGFPVVPQG